MMQPYNQQIFTYARQFTENAFRAQAVVLKGLEQLAELQLGALEQQSRETVEFFSAASGVHDPEGLRGLWDKGVALGRAQAEQAVTLGQGVAGIGRQAVESLGALAQVQPAANDGAAATARKGSAAK